VEKKNSTRSPRGGRRRGRRNLMKSIFVCTIEEEKEEKEGEVFLCIE